MSEPYTYPDVENLVIGYLEEQFAEVGEDVTVAIGVPIGWKAGDTEHIQVVCDGVPSLAHPVVAHTAIRVVARAEYTEEAKRLALLAGAFLDAHPGGGGIAGCHWFTGPLATRDTETEAELASITARVSVRSVSIPAAS